MSKKISIVIAAYNEESRIANVLKIVEKHPLIKEVIVVNDGSTDKTADVVKKFAVTLINNDVNMGKTLSVKKGIDNASGELIMLLDADLIGLKDKSIELLAQPVLDNKVDWSLSIRSNSYDAFRIMKLTKVDWLSGERVVPKELLKDPLIWSRPDVGYGLEVLMNKSLLSRHKSFKSVYLPGVVNPTKSNKDGFFGGLKSQTKMVMQISKVMPPHTVLFQLFKMAHLNKKYSA